jgi:subtilisin family serine protease
VAILDTGLGYTHLDLVGRVDLANSVSFVPSDDALVQANFPGAHLVADLHYHGTHVGATVASNALAAAGVTSGVTLIGVKVCRVINLGTPQVNATCPTSAVLAGILHAADVGAHVANMSLGGTFNRRDASGDPSFIEIINSVFNYAREKNLTIVVAAGNAAIDLDHNRNQYAVYCDSPHVICVSATGPTASGGVNGPWTNVDALASYSNYGRTVEVAAPGGTSPGLIWEACSTFSLVVPVCQTGTFVVGIGGTSMASPHTAGVAALIAEDVGRSPSKIRSKLLRTTDDLGQPGTDPFYGAGRINALRAIH